MPATPRVTTVTSTVAAEVRAGSAEIASDPLALTVKQPAAGPDWQGVRTTAVPARCSAVLPIRIAEALARLVPVTVAAPPPEIVPVAGEIATDAGVAGTVIGTVTVARPGFASMEDEVVVVAVWISDGVTPVPVTVATTVSVGSVVPAGNGPPADAQVIDRPAGG